MTQSNKHHPIAFSLSVVLSSACRPIPHLLHLLQLVLEAVGQPPHRVLVLRVEKVGLVGLGVLDHPPVLAELRRLLLVGRAAAPAAATGALAFTLQKTDNTQKRAKLRQTKRGGWTDRGGSRETWRAIEVL